MADCGLGALVSLSIASVRVQREVHSVFEGPYAAQCGSINIANQIHLCGGAYSSATWKAMAAYATALSDLSDVVGNSSTPML
jgi:hypothetical protein